jgi:hypothetical protein
MRPSMVIGYTPPNSEINVLEGYTKQLPLKNIIIHCQIEKGDTMKMKRMICWIICMAFAIVLTACSSVKETTEGQEKITEGQEEILGEQQETQGETEPGQSSVQGGVHMQQPVSEEFDTIGEIKRFFDTSTVSSGNSLGASHIKGVTDYHSQTEALSISNTVNALMIPVAKKSANAEGFGATWWPESKNLQIIYIIDGVQYRFIYFLKDHYPWVFDDPIVEDVQVGPYVLDFETAEPPVVFDSCFVSGIQIENQTVYLAIRVAGNGIESPTFEAFDFVSLSSVVE